MRASILFLMFLLFIAGHAAGQTPPPDKITTLPTVDKNLVIRGERVGKIFEQFRQQVGAYLKEIEEAKDYDNWKVPPSKSFEQ